MAPVSWKMYTVGCFSSVYRLLTKNPIFTSTAKWSCPGASGFNRALSYVARERSVFFFKGPKKDLLLSWLLLSPGECCLLSASVGCSWQKSPRCTPAHPLHSKHSLQCKRQCSPPSGDPSSLPGWSYFSSDPHSSQFPCKSDSVTSWGDLS